MNSSDRQKRKEKNRTHEVTRYIESKSGAKYGIRSSFSEIYNAEHSIRMDVCIDVRLARSMIDPPANLRKHDGEQVHPFKHEYKNSKRYRRDFQFTALEIGECMVVTAVTRAQSCSRDVRCRRSVDVGPQNTSDWNYLCQLLECRECADGPNNDADGRLAAPQNS
jgi:hypothetical protein